MNIIFCFFISSGTWAESEAERLLRALLKYSKGRTGAVTAGLDDPEAVIEDGNIHFKMFDAMKKEFKFMRILWRQIYDHVAGVDELNMAGMRLRLRFEDEPVPTVVNYEGASKEISFPFL